MNIKGKLKTLAAALLAAAGTFAPSGADAEERPQAMFGTDSKGITWAYTLNSDGEACVGWREWYGYWLERAVPQDTAGDVTIPSEIGGHPVTSIGKWAFYGCNNLTSVTIPDTVTEIGDCAFLRCKIKSVKIGANVKKLGVACFQGCKELLSVEIPDSVTDVERSAFAQCTSVRSLKIGKGLKEVNYAVSTSSYYGTGNPPSQLGITGAGIVITVYANPFQSLTSLVEVKFSPDLTDLGWESFYYSSNLKYAYFLGTLPKLHSQESGNMRGAKWRACYVTHEAYPDGLPSSTWAGVPLRYFDGNFPQEGDEPYDFYLYAVTDTVNGMDYDWPTPVMVTTNGYVQGTTIPYSASTISEGDTVFLSYAFDEYWRGEAFVVTNRFTLSGAKSAEFDFVSEKNAHGTYDFLWKTNATPDALQNLEPGEYTLTLQLNGDNRLKETDYSNNSTSITFTVVSGEQKSGPDGRIAGLYINWGGPYGPEIDPGSGYAESPGCTMLFTVQKRTWTFGGNNYADYYVDNPAVVECTVYRRQSADDKEVAIATVMSSIDGWNWFTDYDVTPGVKYIYEIRANDASSGLMDVTARYTYRAELGESEVVFDRNEGERSVDVTIYKVTEAGSTVESPAYFLTKTKDGDEWCGATRSDDNRHCIIYVDENDTGMARESVVTIEYDGFTRPIKIRQKAQWTEMQQEPNWEVVGHSIFWWHYGSDVDPGCVMSWEVDKVERDINPNSSSYGLEVISPCRATCTVYRDGVAIAEVARGDEEMTWFSDLDVEPGTTHSYSVSANGKSTDPIELTCHFLYDAEIGTNEVTLAAEGHREKVAVEVRKVTELSSTFAYWDNPECSEDWLHAEIADSWRSVAISADENDTGTPREGVVSILCGGCNWQIKVKQEAKGEVEPQPEDLKDGDPMPVVIVINDITVNVTVIVGEEWGTNLPTPAVRPGWTFVGWYTGENGTGSLVSASTKASVMTRRLYAHYVRNEDVVTYYLYNSVLGTVPQAAATVYDGYLYRNGTIAGTIQVKVGKPNAKTGLAAVKATVIGLDGKKKTLKASEKGKAKIVADGPTTVTLTGGEACEVTLGTKALSGTYGSYAIDGALNVFTSKDVADKAVATAVLGKWQGAVNVAWQGAQGWNGISVSIAAKGKAKVSGTLANGTKVSAKGQLIVGEEWCCVPVVVSKKAKFAFNVWLPKVATSAALPAVVGLSDAIVGKPGTLKGGAAFRLDAVLGDAKYETYLPDGLAVGGGAKWTLPKAGKVQLAKDGTVDAAKLGENPSALKLTYKAKDGSFKGSFKAYADVNGKPKGTTVKVTGVLVNGVGYGSATLNKASTPVTIE